MHVASLEGGNGCRTRLNRKLNDSSVQVSGFRLRLQMKSNRKKSFSEPERKSTLISGEK